MVNNAAGASFVFSKAFEPMRKAKWSLKGVDDAHGLRDRLVNSFNSRLISMKIVFVTNSQAAAVSKTYELRYPLFLSSAALQEFQRQLLG